MNWCKSRTRKVIELCVCIQITVLQFSGVLKTMDGSNLSGGALEMSYSYLTCLREVESSLINRRNRKIREVGLFVF